MKSKQFCKKVFSIALAYVFLFANSGFAQMIVTDGRTDTSVKQNGSIYDINTSTVSGNTGFNSFSKFDVYENTTANMHLPDGTSNLVNLVNGPQSNINGVLNSYKNGQIGGNVFFLNPNGIMIGANGVVNVGSLTLMTPTKEFMETVLNEDKTASQTATKAILAGDLPIDSRGLISVKGKIKALGGVGMLGGSVRNDGQISSNFKTSDIVNTAGIKEGGVFVQDGKIVIKAQEDFVNTGNISADVNGIDDGAQININAKNISLEGGTISANAQQGKGGKIVILAENNANFEKGALIEAKSENNDGGFIELSANKEVFLNGGSFAANGGKGKKNGKVFIDPENVTVSEDVNSNGTDYEISADKTLTVNSGVKIKTASSGEGDSGDITLKGAIINLNSGAVLDASVSEANAAKGHKAGDISIEAKDKDGGLFSETSAQVNIGNNVLISGKDVKISAKAETENPFDGKSSMETLRQKISEVILDLISNDYLKIVYLDTSADAKVDIGSGANIQALGKIDISTEAKAKSKVKLKGAKVVGAAVISDTQSLITVAENAVLSAGGDVKLKASAKNTVEMESKSISSKEKGHDPNLSIAFAYGEITGKTEVSLAQNSQISAGGDVKLNAETTTDNSVGAWAQSKDSSFAGVSVAVALSEVENNVIADGNINAQNVEINSSLTSEGFESWAKSGVGGSSDKNKNKDKEKDKDKEDNNNNSDNNDNNDNNDEPAAPSAGDNDDNNDNNDNNDEPPAPSAGDNDDNNDNNDNDNNDNNDNDNNDNNDEPAAPSADEEDEEEPEDMDMDVKKDKLDEKVGNKDTNGKSGVKLAVGAALSYIDYDNTATAKIGGHGNITAAEDIKVEAEHSNEVIRQSAGAYIDSKKKNKIQNAVAAAVNIANFNGTAIAGIDDGATVNLGGTLDVTASYEMPYEPTWWEVFETKDPEKIYKDLELKWKDDNKGLQKGFVSVFSQSGISDDSDDDEGMNIGIAGTVHVTDFTQNVNAYIGAAEINQNIDNSADQKVNVDASATLQLVSLGGMWELSTEGVVDGDKGLGGSYIQNWYDSDVKAEIKDGAKINTSALSVTSELDQIDVTIGLANAESETFGFEGVFNWLKADNEVKAGISKNADITVRGDNADDKLSVSANDNSNFINIAGSVLRGENTGVGASVAVTDITKNTRAYLGDDINSLASAAMGSFTVNADAEIDAVNEGNIIGLTLAGAVSSAENKQEENDAEGGNGKYGIGISGDVVYSDIDTKALAYANNIVYGGEGDVSFSAEDSHSIYNVAGSLGIGMGGESVSVGIAGAATVSAISNGTVAEILNSDFDQDGEISLDANSYSNVVTVAVSGSGATGQGVNVAVAGSVSVNQFENDIKAAVVNSDIDADNLEVNAENDSKITAVAGAFDYAGGDSTSVGVGTSVTYNDIDNSTKAFAQDSALTLAQKALFSAQDTSRIIAVAGTAGVSTGLLAVEASLSINSIENDVLSYVKDSSVTSGADTEIKAGNSADMTVVAGQISYGGKVAVGASAATSKIRNNTKAYAEDADIDGKNILIRSDSSTDIVTSAAGVAASKGNVAVAGSVAVNDIDTETSAFTKAGTLDADGSIGILAVSNNDIAFYGGNLAGSNNVGVGATVAVNILRDRAYSYAQDSTLNALGNYSLALGDKTVKGVGVNTYLDDHFKEIIINGALGIEAAGVAGTVDVNTVSNEAEAYIANSKVNTLADGASDSQQVDVYAENKISSEVYGGSLGISGGGAGIGAVAEVANIENNTYAGIKDNSIVKAKKSVNTETYSEENYDSILIAGGASGQVGVAGAVNVALMNGTNKAEIKDSSVYSEGDITVQAKDEANLGKNNSVSVGSAGIGIGIAGIGGSVLVTNNKNETTAQIVSAEVDAEKDLKVHADSVSSLKGYVPTGGAGLYAGIAASVAVNTVNTQANAYISGSTVNESAFAKTSKTQNVEVSADSQTDLENVVASLGGGLVGVGAAVAVNNIHNSAKAGVLNNSSVKSTGDISVKAKSDKDATSVTAALGAGGVGLSGSVSVLNIGGAIDEEALSNISDAANVSNTELGRNKQLTAANLGNNGYFADTIDVVHNNANTDVSEELSASLKRAQGTSAFVDGSSLISKGSSKINAEDIVTYDNAAGGLATGAAVAVGASVATANIESKTNAFLGDNSSIVSGKNIDINAVSKVDSSKLLGIIGAASGFIGLSAVVASADEETDALVYTGKNSVLSADEDINITSKTASNTKSQTVGVTASEGLAAGASVSKITKGGTSGVLLDDNSSITKGNVKAVAYTDADNYAEAEAGAGGIIAGSGSVALVDNKDKIYAKTGKNVNVSANSFMLATEGKAAASTKNIGVNIGGLTIGVNVGQTDINLDNTVEVGEDNTITSDDTNILARQKKAEARSEATGGSGALVGGTGVSVTNTVDGKVRTDIKDGTNLKGMLVNIGSDLKTDQESEVNYYSAALAGVGGNVAKIYNNANTVTQLGNGLTADARKLAVYANADNRSYANVKSGSGGVLDVAVGAAKTESNNSSKVLIGTAGSDKGNYLSAGEILLSANHSNTQDSAIDMISVGGITGSGMSNTNNSIQNVLVDIEGLNNIIADKITVSALNNFKKDIVQDQNMYYRGGGGVQISVGDSSTNVKDNTDIIFGDNTSVLAKDKESHSALLVNAFNNVKAYDYVKLNAGALIEAPILTSKIENNGHADITVNQASLKSYGNSVFNAKTDLDLNATDNMSIYGAAGVAHGVAVVDSHNTNNVTLNNGADVFAVGDIDIGLTQPVNVPDVESFPRAKINLLAKTQIWNKTAVPVSANSYAEVNHTTTDKVNIKEGASLRSGTSVKIHTGMPIEKSEGIFDYVSYLGAVAASNKTAHVNSTYYSKVNNDGTILAGAGNRQYITAKNADDGSLDVNISDPEGNVSYVETEESLVNNLMAEIEKYQQLKQQYSASDPLALGYQAEIDRLMNELRELQLIDKAVDPNTGKEVEFIKKVSDVKFLTFDDLSANHGDILIDVSDLNGTGTMEARGSSVLSITNESDRFLRLNDVKINNDASGTIYYNSFAVTTPEQIRDINTREKKVLFASENVKSDHGKGGQSLLTISSTYNLGALGINTEMQGDIENLGGKVKINTTGSLYAKGNVRANSVEMSANKNIIQYMIEGFRHLGGDPSSQWSSIASAHESAKTTTNTEETAEETGLSSIIANNVFISGRYLNLNGLVQSGTSDYSLHIDDADIVLSDFANIELAKADYAKNAEGNSAVVSPLYKLADKYGSLDAYYNVLTDNIEVNDVQVEGGHMELIGHIMNTSTKGNGELRVLDGYGQVDIVNNSAHDLVINSFDTSKKVEGYLKITDLAQTDPSGRALETIYKRVNGQVQEVNSMTRDENGNPNNIVSDNASVYNPLAGQRYKWMTGQETLKRETYYREESSFWGIQYDDLSEYTKTVENVDPTPLLEGSLLILDDTSNSHAYSYTYDDIAIGSPVITLDKAWTTSDGWWIFSTKTYHHQLIKEQGRKNYNTHSIKADNPVKINFGGHDNGNINIVSNNSNILLSGLLNNPTGTVTVTSANNAVDNIGNAKIVGKDINLTGKAGIGVSDEIVTSINGGVLTAISQEGDIVLRNIDSEFKIGTVSAANGIVSLTAAGNIVNRDGSSLITAKELNLITASAIGSNTDALNISTGKISAQAVDDIDLNQTGGDLGIELISSEKGNLTLTADGGVYDSSEEEIADSRTLEDKMKDWEEMKLFDEAGWTEDQLVYAVGYQSTAVDYIDDTTTAIPSVTASKITIHSGDAIGTRLQTTTIDISDGRTLTDTEKKMIANAPSKRIRVDKENSTLTINNNKPIVFKGDIVNVEAENGIYLRQTNDNLKSDYIRNTNSGEIRLEVPTSNIEIKDLQIQDGGIRLVFGKDWHSLAYLLNKDIKKMTIEPAAAIMPQDIVLTMPPSTINNNLDSVAYMPDYDMDSMVRTMNNLQSSVKKDNPEENI